MLLKTDDLRQWLGYERPADIIKWLDRHHIPWRHGKAGEICTTLEAVNQGIAGTEKRTPARFG